MRTRFPTGRRKTWAIWEGDCTDNIVFTGSRKGCMAWLRERGAIRDWRHGKSRYHVGYDLC